MPTAEEAYTESMFGQFSYLANWLPGTPLKLGLIGVLQGKTFVPKSPIGTFGVRFGTTSEPGPQQSLQFQSSSEIKVDVKVAGEVSKLVPALPEAQAGAAVSFGASSGVVFHARGITISRVSDVIGLEAAIWDLWDRGIWNPDWVVITELVKADRTTVLISEGRYGKVELGVSAAVPAGPVDLGDLTGDLSVVSSYGMHTQLIGEGGLSPLFRAVRIKKSLFGTKITGARAALPPTEPGVTPRRGAERPDGDLTEDATD
ncbi:hypothetical protein [Kribbella sp. NPDC051770]|uniref:hypothetical protein n=1 Tax=Kribbella sp. NPDC051770 TaxID=3155413 RepID=UPI003441FD94